jgi:hypothetical protein
MIHTLTEVDRLIELAIIQRSELKKLVDSLPELRTHLSIEIEKNVEQIEPHLRAELEVFLSARAKDENAKLGELLQSKIETLCDDLETTTAAKYSAITLYKEKVIDLEKIAEKKIIEAGERIGVEVPAQVEKLVEEKFARFPRAGEIDQLRKEFAEPKGLNPRGKWESGVTYYKLDLVAYNGDSYVANEETTQKPNRNSAAWTLNAARGAAGSGNNISLVELTGAPANGQILIGSNGSFVNADITAGDGIAISTAAGFIEISADGGTNYQGTWDAATNNPALTSSVGTKGYYYVVNVDGSTNLNGITDWKVGDWAIYNGSVWQKVDNSESVTSVFGRVGSITAVAGDYSATQITNTAAGSITATNVQDAINELDGEKLAKASNLSDVASVTTSRTNLGVTATGADTTYAYRANNLNDLASVTSARTNLGLGSAATQNDTYFLQVANNLSDLASVTTARSNLALGSIATQNASNVSITGGSITGITDLAVADGGTGVSTSTGTTNVVLSNSPTIVTPVIAQINDASANATLKLASIASAVNQVTIENAATGNAVHITATGGDASVGLHLAGKGASGYVNVQDSVDATKRLMFNAAGGTTNTRTMLSSTQTVDRTISLPDATDTLVGKATTDTLTNKTLTSPTLTTPILGTPQSGTLSSCTGLPISTGISGLGTGIATALAINTGSAGAPVLFNGALGTPTSGTVTNLTGTASININGTVGATTAAAGKFTTVAASSTITSTVVSGGVLQASSGTTGTLYAYLQNTGGQLLLGLESSVGGSTTAGTDAYAALIGSQSANNVNFLVNNVLVGKLTSTGLNSTAIGATTPSTIAATTISATGLVTVNGATTPAGKPAALTGTMMHITMADSGRYGILVDSFGTAAEFVGRRASGTSAAPSAIANGAGILRISPMGYGATAYSSSTTGSVIGFFATQAWTDSAQGTSIVMNTTPNGSTSSATVLTLGNDKSATFTGTGTFSGALAIGNTVDAAVAVASTHKVTIVIGGVTYYLLATNV